LPVNFQQLLLVKEKLSNFKNSELMVVTKNRTSDDVETLIQQNQLIFGENKVQEAQKKFLNISNNRIKIHLIGPLQTNKVKIALNLFDTIQSLDREKLIIEIANHLNKNSEKIRTKNFFIQINIGQEEQKSGVAPESALALYQLALINKLNVVGLMCIPPKNDDPKFYFKKMVELKNKLNQNLKLSMGMSEDYLEALECGSDIVRIGSKIFQ
jgi:pyridoxal phosphate enzyme (YggS family)